MGRRIESLEEEVDSLFGKYYLLVSLIEKQYLEIDKLNNRLKLIDKLNNRLNLLDDMRQQEKIIRTKDKQRQYNAEELKVFREKYFQNENDYTDELIKLDSLQDKYDEIKAGGKQQ